MEKNKVLVGNGGTEKSSLADINRKLSSCFDSRPLRSRSKPYHVAIPFKNSMNGLLTSQLRR